MAQNPDQAVVFNANVATKENGKLWHGDLDASLMEDGLIDLSRRLDETVYLLADADARFRNEERPLLDRAVYSVTPEGYTKFDCRRFERRHDGDRPPFVGPAAMRVGVVSVLFFR
jgi:hypothetical protein